jgi:diguanylate cyclase (GGDEF)-like protein
MDDSRTPLSPEIGAGLGETGEMAALLRRCQQAEAALQALEYRNGIMGDSAPFGIFAIDQEGRLQGINRKMRDLVSWPEAPTLAEINVYELQAFVEAGICDDLRLCMQSKHAMIRDYACVANKGECRQLRVHFGPVVEPTGTVSGVMAFVENRTHFQRAQLAAQESEERYRNLFQSAPVAMIERDASALKQYLEELQASGVKDLEVYLRERPDEVGRCMAMIRTEDCNNAFLALLEARIEDKEAILADLPRVVMGPGFLQVAQEIIVMVARGRFIPEREMTIRTVHGQSKRVMSRVMVLAGHETTMARVVISLVDISTRVAAEEALRASEQRFREQALHDNLTGLYNQRYLHYSLPRLIQNARTQERPISVIFMDLDNFKKVVDTYGHLNGSRAIQEVGAILGTALLPPAYAVAYAGDEFVAVLPEHDLEQALAKAEELQARIRGAVFLQSLGKNVRLQASCGIATYPTHGDDAEAILAAADSALFDVKGTGKGAIGRYQKLNPE